MKKDFLIKIFIINFLMNYFKQIIINNNKKEKKMKNY